MVLVRPRLNDYYDLPFTQEQVSFAIPLLETDIPLYVDPFLLWKSPSQQDNGLHTALLASFNRIGWIYANEDAAKAVALMIALSECSEVGLGTALNRQGMRIGDSLAHEILSVFQLIPQVAQRGLQHLEELQLLVDQIGKDRISDIACNLLKSFLIDFTIDQCRQWSIPVSAVESVEVFDYRSVKIQAERIDLPVNPQTGFPVLLVPKRWLRHLPWINFDDFFKFAVSDESIAGFGRIDVLNYNRRNYDMVLAYLSQKERVQDDCRNDPLFRQIPVTSAKRHLSEIRKLPTGKSKNADKRYEDLVGQLLASLFYPQLDFAEEQSRTDSGALIRDLIFYNNRSMDFLQDIFTEYWSRQIVVEMKNVQSIEREHINQVNRYLVEQFGRFGVIVTRNSLPRAMFRSTIDLWAGQRKCIIALTDEDLAQMVDIFESRQRLPVEVMKRAFIEFTRACPA
jgi:hypothetical protein